ncbi:hypothetical protein [Nonlabens tegetincola]|uniref:hypothetical protein n=1 Tax=Nonlabens tegetincola TaxID=323273 RepID=UPI0011B01F7F|nr:hypothetical protein [Nonlabens tegetincola]
MEPIQTIHGSYDPSSVTLAVTSMVDCDGDGVTDADEIANGPIQMMHVVTMLRCNSSSNKHSRL